MLIVYSRSSYTPDDNNRCDFKELVVCVNGAVVKFMTTFNEMSCYLKKRQFFISFLVPGTHSAP